MKTPFIFPISLGRCLRSIYLSVCLPTCLSVSDWLTDYLLACVRHVLLLKLKKKIISAIIDIIIVADCYCCWRMMADIILSAAVSCIHWSAGHYFTVRKTDALFSFFFLFHSLILFLYFQPQMEENSYIPGDHNSVIRKGKS